MSELTSAAPGRTLSAVILSGSAAICAALGWITLVVVGRLEGQAVFSTAAVIWAVYYGSAGILSGLQHEVTRTRLEQPPISSGPTGTPLVVAALIVGAGGAGVLTASFPFWHRDLDVGWPAAGGMAIGILGLAGLVTVLGLLAAKGRWRLMSALLLVDASARLVGVVTVATAGGTAAGYAAAVGGASWIWLPAAFSDRIGGDLRSDLASRLHLRPFLTKAGAAMLATGCASLIVAGFPWLMATVSGAAAVESAGLLAALVLFRSPILALVNSVRPLVLRELMTSTSVAKAGVLRLWKWSAVGGAALAVLAFAAGPEALTATFGSGFEITRTQAAGLVVSAVLLAMAMVATMGLLAIDAHGRVMECWMLALAVTVPVLMVGDDGDTMVAAAIIGPLAAIGWTVLRGWDVRSRVRGPEGMRSVAR